MNEQQTFVCHRLVIRGELLVPQALHIGSGESSRQSDSPIRRDGKGRPYIPGSTLGGILRGSARDFAPYFFSEPKSAIDDLFGRAGGRRDTEGLGEGADDLTEIKNDASRVIVEDAFLVNDSLSTPLSQTSEVRDYVGIDRRKNAARPRLQYDREVVPSNTRYHFEISVENPKQDEICLLLAVLDFWSEFDFALHIGGRTTTGVGRARLDASSLDFYKLDFSNKRILLDYLLHPGCNPDDIVEHLPEESKVSREDIAPQTFNCISPETTPKTEAFLSQHLLLTIALTPEEPILVQGAVPEIPGPDATLYGKNRTSDADFLTALVVGDNGNISEKQYIPGSSLKGILRARAEKIVRTLNFYRGNPDISTKDYYDSAEAEYYGRICACAITHSEKEKNTPEGLDKLLSCFGTPQKQRNAQQISQQLSDSYSRELYDTSCLTCRLFGNSLMKGRLHVSDAELTIEPDMKLFDNVAIDRFHSGAEDRQKFDTRPMMPKPDESKTNSTEDFQPMFKFYIHLERPEPWMLGLLGHLLKDLKTADIRVGSNSQRGYGKVSGDVTSAQLLVLPNSKLEELCRENGLLTEEENESGRLGPYRRLALELPRLFGTEKWETKKLNDDAAQIPTAHLLKECHQQFQELVKKEEEKPHGDFYIQSGTEPSLSRS